MSNQQLVQELTVALRNSKVQLDSVQQQLFVLERQEKLAEFTTKELESYPSGEVWRSCGKSFILQDKKNYISDLKHDESVLKEQKKALDIKQNYLQTTIEKTVDGLKAVLTQKQ